MRAYDLIQADWVIIVLLAGAALALAFHLALHRARDEDKGPSGEPHEYPGGVSARSQPVPVFLWVLYAAVALFALVYFVRAWLTGMAF